VYCRGTSDSEDGVPPPYPGAYRFAPDPIWKNEKNPAIEIKFPLHLFLSIASMSEDKRSARWHENVIPRLREKGLSKGMLKSY
jgi:hypothetical protein